MKPYETKVSKSTMQISATDSYFLENMLNFTKKIWFMSIISQRWMKDIKTPAKMKKRQL